jgi:hypothetical protein
MTLLKAFVFMDWSLGIESLFRRDRRFINENEKMEEEW